MSVQTSCKNGQKKHDDLTLIALSGESIGSILENYNVLKELWDECLEQHLTPDVKCRIIGVKAQMSTFSVLFGLRLCERILRITDNLSKTLQNESLCAAEAQILLGRQLNTRVY